MRLKTKFRNEVFELGEIVDAEVYHGGSHAIKVEVIAKQGGAHSFFYDSLASMYEKWEDAPEEAEMGYIIDPMEEDYVSADDSGYEESDVERAKELGIWFKTEEEAERAVEKLKAFRRLKDKGFRFNNWDLDADDEDVNVLLSSETYKGKKVYDFAKDLDLLFGGGEE